VNIHDFTGKPLPDFLRDRGFALFDALFAAAVMAVLIFVVKRLSRAKLLVRYSLRTKLLFCVLLLAIVCGVSVLFKVNALVLLVLSFLAFALLIYWLMNDLTRVGIANAFETTRKGVSAADSLKLVKRDLVFLGIGAKKLTETTEFDEMLARCKAAHGQVRFLLSNPENEALEELARQNGRNDLSYRSRVKESIREIFTRATSSGVDFEVRLYDLKQKVSLPRFRLVFIDGQLCVFSQLRWSEGEGLDNPQLILRSNGSSAESSLYKGYRDYFDDLWDLDTTVKVTPEVINSWPA
jgi:Ca2+/Na+ antiporter